MHRFASRVRQGEGTDLYTGNHTLFVLQLGKGFAYGNCDNAKQSWYSEDNNKCKRRNGRERDKPSCIHWPRHQSLKREPLFILQMHTFSYCKREREVLAEAVTMLNSLNKEWDNSKGEKEEQMKEEKMNCRAHIGLDIKAGEGNRSLHCWCRQCSYCKEEKGVHTETVTKLKARNSMT